MASSTSESRRHQISFLPFIFSWPGEIEAGQVYDAGLVSVIDLAPTLLEVADAPVPKAMQGESAHQLLTDPAAYEGRKYVFAERNWHDCDEHIRSVRTERYKLVRGGDYTEVPHCTPADVASSPSWFSLKQLQEQNALTKAQRQLFQAPRPHVELYDLEQDPWEINNVADEAGHQSTARRLSKAVLARWMEATGDFSPSNRKRADHTDRVTGVWFRSDIPPMRNDIE